MSETCGLKIEGFIFILIQINSVDQHLAVSNCILGCVQGNTNLAINHNFREKISISINLVSEKFHMFSTKSTHH